jgi:UDP-N-acetylglucosamine acyltransferase
MPKVHPTAIVHPSAEVADDVEIGPYCVVEGDVRIGPACRLREHVIVRRYTTLGRHNVLDAYTVLGGEPQDYKFDVESVTHLRIGDDNVFREGCTLSRATTPGGATVVGNRTYWMTGAHAGHDSVVEDDAILINQCALAGHTVLGRKAILSAHVVVHQFCWVGEMVMTQGNCAIGMHTPPYVVVAGVSDVVGLNAIGLRRSPDISEEDRRQIKEAYNITYRSGIGTSQALEKMDECKDWAAPAGRFREFIRKVLTAKKPFRRGICHLRNRHADDDE